MDRAQRRAARARHAVRGRVQAALGRAGWELRPASDDADRRRAKLLERERVDLVLDVGANVGQYGMRLRTNGYRGRIVSFEPYSQAFAQLERTASRDPMWEAHRVALGEEKGEAELNVAGNSFSSSLLPIADRHQRSAPDAAYVDTEVVPTARLDSLWGRIADGGTVWLKLDVQGFEMQVLRGAGERLADTRVVQSELSLRPLYDGAPPWIAVVEWLADRGFALAGVEPGFEDPDSGHMLQLDGIFVRDHR